MKDGYSICFNEWALDKEIKNGLTTKEAIKKVASQTNVNKKELYQFYHNEKGE